jgi:hypothetical protein
MAWAVRPELQSLLFPVQISDRGNRHSPSAAEVVPLSIHREIILTHQELDFLAWTWDTTDKGDRGYAGWIKYPQKEIQKSVFQ